MLLDKNHQTSFDSMDHHLLRQLISFLKFFVDVTELLSNERQSALQLVLLCREKLIQVAKESSDNEHQSLIKFKNTFFNIYKVIALFKMNMIELQFDILNLKN